MARKNYQIWTPKAEAYLRKKYARHDAAYLLRGLARLGQKSRTGEQIVRKANEMGLHKDAEWLKAERQRSALECCEKRGEDFAEKQRQRALHPGESGWWGGKHHDGNSLDREVRAENARRLFHSKQETKEKRMATRKKRLEHDLRRVALGLEPLTGMVKPDGPMTRQQYSRRAQLKHECGYVLFNGDRRIYYDENTRRSEKRERNAEAIGLYCYPISQRKLFESNN